MRSIRTLAQAMMLALLACGLAACGINDIPTYEEQAKASWSEVLNQYQRRTDLIPNLVETVKGYATQERETLTAVTEARAKVGQMQLPSDVLTNEKAFLQFQQNQEALRGALSRLMVVVERYPDLKSNQNFLGLQAQLEGTENRIAVARRDYIMAVQRYNTELRTLPGSIWAALLYRDAKVMQTFSIEPAAQQVPKVDFGDKK
jgi:LemA protein